MLLSIGFNQPLLPATLFTVKIITHNYWHKGKSWHESQRQRNHTQVISLHLGCLCGFWCFVGCNKRIEGCLAWTPPPSPLPLPPHTHTYAHTRLPCFSVNSRYGYAFYNAHGQENIGTLKGATYTYSVPLNIHLIYRTWGHKKSHAWKQTHDDSSWETYMQCTQASTHIDSRMAPTFSSPIN